MAAGAIAICGQKRELKNAAAKTSTTPVNHYLAVVFETAHPRSVVKSLQCILLCVLATSLLFMSPKIMIFEGYEDLNPESYRSTQALP